MTQTVIDKLVVQLGLDPKGFKKGEKEAERSLTDVEIKTKKTADAMAASIARVTRDFVGLFIAMRSIQDVSHFFTNLTGSTRQLGLDAKNFGTSAAELRDWQNAAVLAGGKAEDVTKTIASLQQSLFNFRFKGDFSDQLMWLQRLGVSFQTAAGAARPFNDVMIDTARAIERAHFDRPTAFQYLSSAGFDTGSINLILQGTKAVEAAIAAQRKLPQVSEADVEAATKLQVGWDKLTQSFEAGAIKLETGAAPAIQTIFDLLQEGINWLNANGPAFTKQINEWATSFSEWVKAPDSQAKLKQFFTDVADDASKLSKVLDVLSFVFKHLFDTPVLDVASKIFGAMKDMVMGAVNFANQAYDAASPRGLRNNNPGNLKATSKDEKQDSEGFRIFEKEEDGIEAANTQLNIYQKRGLNTIRQIITMWAPAADKNNVPAYIAEVEKTTGVKADAQLSAADRQQVLQGIFDHEVGSNRILNFEIQDALKAHALAPNPNALRSGRAAAPTPSAQSAPSAPPTSSNVAPASSTTVDIASITVNTAATDANRMVADMDRIVRRKFLAAQSDSGILV